MKRFALCIIALLLMSATPTYVKTADLVAYNKYLAYCKAPHYYEVTQYGRTTYDHITVAQHDYNWGPNNEFTTKAGTKSYFFNAADTVWYDLDKLDYMEKYTPTMKPEVRFDENDPLNGTIALETVNTPRYKKLVSELQQCLIKLGYPTIVVDGIYGSYTSKAVSLFVAKWMFYNIITSTTNLKLVSVDMIRKIKLEASRAGLDTSEFSLGKKSSEVTRSVKCVCPQRRYSIGDFYEGVFDKGVIFTYFKSLP